MTAEPALRQIVIRQGGRYELPSPTVCVTARGVRVQAYDLTARRMGEVLERFRLWVEEPPPPSGDLRGYVESALFEALPGFNSVNGYTASYERIK